jgi:hypothetical protein
MSNLFESIINEQLSSVEFVQDYLQLHFDGNTLTCYAWPVVILNGTHYTFKDNGYRDALCNLIALKVNSVMLTEGYTLLISFTNQNQIMLELHRDGKTDSLPELAYFTSEDGKWFVLD